ncbi:FAD-dependent pyridine nucleotide-disulphide oxidoreductase family protein [Deferribacter desulfuricans SSM1]|uniref:FAD-dependent pyridine nucleotide-disulphide oxidoreductase family protein n=1 Tax=Deferribacter desulfuricans (strain DSM 14783 / JCM 11476 / NBRC 101012 / SSM1) TaxID=639282 RepID=D3PAX9_DEFDS|nr:FAD-dependent oxidoreductase [Deferribacter desulfuricans]BAI79752.1 FAD-dependent pyridine nucleotide-disulphide oxidoreductase family protein [Deferribacter desulfuricans SSM1]
MKHYDIVALGNSAASLSFVTTLRKFNNDKSILMVDRENLPAYSRVLTPYYVANKTDRDGIFIVNSEFYKSKGIDTIFGKTVVSVDFDKRYVHLDDGEIINYKYLFIGLGAEATKIGLESDRVLNLRHLNDADKLHELYKTAKSVVGFGAGLVTIPLLSHLKDDVEKYLVISSDRVFSRVVDKDAASIIEDTMKNKGVKIYKKDNIKSIKTNKENISVELESGNSLVADFAIIGKGVTQNTHIFKDSSLNINWGILVNEYCQTNIENVYAGGDIAEDLDFITKEYTTQGNWITAVEHGEIAAKHILGIKEKYDGSIKNNTTEVFGVEVAVVGYFKDDVKTVTFYDQSRRYFRKLFLDENGVIIGCTMVGESNDAGIYYGLIKRRVKFDSFYKPNKFYTFPKILYATNFIS